MKKQNLIISGLILTAASFVSRLLGMVFRVYLSNKIGAEGMGLYQLVFSLYTLASTLATSGIGVAVARLTAEELAKGKPENAGKLLRVSLFLTILLGLTVTAVLYCKADWFGRSFLHDERTIFAVRILAPSFPFISISTCIKGYYYAKRHVMKPASSQILEQLTRMTVIYTVTGLWAPRGLDYACASAVLGITIGEITSCLYCVILYYAEKRERPCRKPGRVLGGILGVSVPVALKSYMNSGFHMVENIIIPPAFERSGMGKAGAMGVYGMLKGMVMPLLLFPTSIIQSFTTVLMPEIAGANATGQKNRVNYAISRVLHFTMVLSILIVCAFLAFSFELGTMLYGSEEVGGMLRLLSFVSPFMYLEMVVVSLLNGIGEQTHSMLYSAADSVVRIALITFLVPWMGMPGFLAVIVISNLMTSLLNLRRLLKVTTLHFNLRSWAVKPVVCALLCGWGVRWLYASGLCGSVVLCLLLLCAAYVAALLLSRCITREDVQWIGGLIRGKK